MNKSTIQFSVKAKVYLTLVLIGIVALLFIGFSQSDEKNATAYIANAASVDYFLKIDDIKGESTDSAHKDWIDVLSWSWGMSQSGSSGSGRTGVAEAEPFTVAKRIDKASPALLTACASGEHHREAELRVSDPKRTDYYIIVFTDVICTSFDQGGDGGEPVEQVSFNFAKIKTTYVPQEPKKGTSPITATWDFLRGTF